MTPLVSVVTPVHNTAAWLGECIERVLSQDYESFEYIVVDNSSTDGSLEIAQQFAERDERVRVVRTSEFLDQIDNFNFALRQISPESKYVKMCLADDSLYPRCLSEMVGLAEAFPSAVVIGALSLKGVEVKNSGLAPGERLLTGREVCRKRLLDDLFLFGSPTTVMYRADLVRARSPFFPEGRIHADTELCFEVLADADFGFVPQVLSFTRLDEGSISGQRGAWLPGILDRLIVTVRFGPTYLTPEEHRVARRQVFREYYRQLARRSLRNLVTPNPGFWEYQRRALATVDVSISRRRLLLALLSQVAAIALSPGDLLAGAARAARRARVRPATSGPTISTADDRHTSSGHRQRGGSVTSPRTLLRGLPPRIAGPIRLARARVTNRHPRTFNEKVRYRMAWDRRPLLVTCVDKAAAKEFAAARVGSEVLPRRYAIADRFADLDPSALPREYVVKVSHASGGIVIVTEGAPRDASWPSADAYFPRFQIHPDDLDWPRLGELVDEWLSLTFQQGVEWAYGRVPPRVIAEELLLDEHGRVPTDYSFYLFDGACRAVDVISDRFGPIADTLMRPDWSVLEPSITGNGTIPPRPDRLDEMISLAERLGDGFDFVRIDLYDLPDRIVFGEATVYPSGGWDIYLPEVDAELGAYWTLPVGPAARRRK